MKIDLRGGSHKWDGFGVAGRSIYDSLERIGHEIDPDSELQLVFTHPNNFVFEGEYSIGYFPWESTEPKPGWKRIMRRMDEIWVTSPVMVDYVREWGFEPFVYQHGVNADWTPRKRTVTDDGKIKFIHQGLEALRKGGRDTLSAFGAAFQGRDDVSLTMKSSARGMEFNFGKVSTETRLLDSRELLDMYYEHQVMIAPSYGEGFGLPALDALGSGMPTIMTKGVFPHEPYADPNLLINSTMVDSLWTEHHPGKVWQPDHDHLVDILRYTADNFEEVSHTAWKNSWKVHEEATWDVRTKKAFDDLALRIE